MTLSRDVLDEIQLQVACGYCDRESLRGSIFESMAESLGVSDDVTHVDQLDIATNKLLTGAIEAAFAQRLAEIQTWPKTTDCDRLQRVFEALDKQGIVGVENCGFTLQDGLTRAVNAVVTRYSPGIRYHSYCFFHAQDVMSAVENGGLYLAFGTIEDDEIDSGTAPEPPRCPTCNGRGWIQPDDRKFPQPCPSHVATAPAQAPLSRTQQVGEAITQACRAAGFDVKWNGEANTRIELPNFVWQRRFA